MLKTMIFSFLLLMGIQNVATSTQKPSYSSVCPQVEISAFEEPEKKLIVFEAEVEGLNQAKAMHDSSMNELTYNWTIDAGTIASGQGKNLIKIDPEGLDDREKISATVEITGFIVSGCSCCLSRDHEFYLK